jgi:hypothetical protein
MQTIKGQRFESVLSAVPREAAIRSLCPESTEDGFVRWRAPVRRLTAFTRAIEILRCLRSKEGLTVGALKTVSTQGGRNAIFGGLTGGQRLSGERGELNGGGHFLGLSFRGGSSGGTKVSAMMVLA